MTRRSWTPDEDDVLRHGYASRTCTSLAAELGRSKGSVYSRLHVLGLRKEIGLALPGSRNSVAIAAILACLREHGSQTRFQMHDRLSAVVSMAGLNSALRRLVRSGLLHGRWLSEPGRRRRVAFALGPGDSMMAEAVASAAARRRAAKAARLGAMAFVTQQLAEVGRQRPVALATTFRGDNMTTRQHDNILDRLDGGRP